MSRRRDGARNFFPMPQKIFNLGMNAGEIAVYAYLMFRENRETYQCYPSYRTIGEAVGMSRNTVKKYVEGLVEKQLIYTEPTSVPTKDGNVRNGNLLYTMVYEGYGAGYYFSGGSASAAMLLGTNPLGYRGYVMDALFQLMVCGK